ncbi:hypothetical protein GCK72_014894 [Caenorhabditis remanei]|uniref:DUF19 domain-containing protein n=1 Tax=Caenorhabditis remanei TaxID=31234 RepID=A0A6A5GV01_CAERE|nr:hypothetical protein GCK72_014894 [Caenorhabditis remanei]KAF1758436.1 hypothetical protein GCK72_014894 [Caenorhabditis remanei]
MIFLLISTTFTQEQVTFWFDMDLKGNDFQDGMTAFESIRRVRECLDKIDKPEFRRTCDGKFGKDKDKCVEKFTKKMMPTINECIGRSHPKTIPVPLREEL